MDLKVFMNRVRILVKKKTQNPFFFWIEESIFGFPPPPPPPPKKKQPICQYKYLSFFQTPFVPKYHPVPQLAGILILGALSLRQSAHLVLLFAPKSYCPSL